MSQPALLPCPALPTLKPSLPEDCPIAPRPPSLPHLPYSRQMCCIFSSFKKRKEENENEKPSLTLHHFQQSLLSVSPPPHPNAFITKLP